MAKTPCDIFQDMCSVWPISNNRIKSIENGIIKFQYKDRRKKNMGKPCPLGRNGIYSKIFFNMSCPQDFMKIRHYGFLNANSSHTIEQICELISLIHDVVIKLLPVTPKFEKPKIKCACCGKPLRFMGLLQVYPHKGTFRIKSPEYYSSLEHKRSQIIGRAL